MTLPIGLSMLLLGLIIGATPDQSFALTIVLSGGGVLAITLALAQADAAEHRRRQSLIAEQVRQVLGTAANDDDKSLR